MPLPKLNQDPDNRVLFQDTTLSKDLIARFSCNTLDEVKAAGLEGVTAIVIGSGMYGAFCAERIYRRGGKAIVLDAGPFVISEHVQNMANPDFAMVEAEGLLGLPAFGEYTSPAKPSEGRKLPIAYVGHSYNAGGKSIRWGGWSPRLTPEDLDLWPDDMAQYFRDYYREIEFQIGAYPTADFIKGALAEVLFTRVTALKSDASLKMIDVLPPPIAVQAEQPVSGLFSFDKYSSLPVLIETLRDDAGKAMNKPLSVEDADSRRGLMLVPRCRVLRLESVATATGRRVNELRVMSGFEPPAITRLAVPPGCAVVLACNSMESTRLALDSLVDPSTAATTQIGRNFQVHLRTDLRLRIPRAAFEADLRHAAGRIVDAKEAAASVLDEADNRPRDEKIDEMLAALQTAAIHIQCSHLNRRFHLQLIALANPGGSGDALLYRQDTSLPELADAVAGQQSSFIALKYILVGEIPASDAPVGSIDAPWAALSETQRDEFFGQGNPAEVAQDYSARKLYTFVPLSQQDEDFWLFMDRTAIKIAEALAGPAGGVQYEYDKKWHDTPPNDDQLRNLHQSLGSTYHECGTMRMGASASDGVVDTRGRFFGIDNLYCCDQAAFVTSGSANPVPTGLVIAKRVAEAIQPDVVVNEVGFTNLFEFDDPVGDYPVLPVGLGDLPIGWKFLGGGRFVRRGRMMESDGGIGVMYYAARQFKDFVLKLQWRCPLIRGNGEFFNNSGVYVRWPETVKVAPGVEQPLEALSLQEIGEYAIKQGYEIQIDDTGYRPKPEFSGFPEEQNNPFHQTGAIYPAYFKEDNNFSPRPRFKVDGVDSIGHPSSFLASRPPGQWNDYAITVQGFRIRVELNGNLVNDAEDLDKRFPRGFIGLQCHFSGYRVQFRNVRIKEL